MKSYCFTRRQHYNLCLTIYRIENLQVLFTRSYQLGLFNWLLSYWTRSYITQVIRKLNAFPWPRGSGPTNSRSLFTSNVTSRTSVLFQERDKVELDVNNNKIIIIINNLSLSFYYDFWSPKSSVLTEWHINRVGTTTVNLDLLVLLPSFRFYLRTIPSKVLVLPSTFYFVFLTLLIWTHYTMSYTIIIDFEYIEIIQ